MTKLLPERRICFDKVSKMLQISYYKLLATKWRFFALDLFRVNEHWIRELYAYPSVVSFSDLVVKILKKEVHFVAEKINDIYGLLNAHMT